MTTIKITPRMVSIRKIQIIRDSSVYRGGDWSDSLAYSLESIPSKMEGISPHEMGILSEVYSCPRMVSGFLSDLSEEIEGLESEIDSLIGDFISIHRKSKKIQEEIIRLKQQDK